MQFIVFIVIFRFTRAPWSMDMEGTRQECAESGRDALLRPVREAHVRHLLFDEIVQCGLELFLPGADHQVCRGIGEFAQPGLEIVADHGHAPILLE